MDTHSNEDDAWIQWMIFWGFEPLSNIFNLGGVEQGKTEGRPCEDELLWVNLGELRPKIIVLMCFVRKYGSSTNSMTVNRAINSFIGCPKCTDPPLNKGFWCVFFHEWNGFREMRLEMASTRNGDITQGRLGKLRLVASS